MPRTITEMAMALPACRALACRQPGPVRSNSGQARDRPGCLTAVMNAKADPGMPVALVAVADLVAGIEAERGRLDVLVNDIFGGDRYAQWDKPLWEHDWAGGLRMLQMGVHTHLITCRAAIPLLLRTAGGLNSRGLVVEMTDGTAEANAEFRRNVGFYYDLVKANVERIVKGLHAEL